MPDPKDKQADADRHDPAVTGVVNSARQELDALSYEYDLPVEAPPPAYVPEPVFNKKVMVAWAAGALVVWFAVTIVVPAAFNAAKSSIVEAVKQAEADGGTGSGPRKIRIERNGHVITIVTDQPASSPATTAPVAAPAPAQPPAPAKPAEPATRR